MSELFTFGIGPGHLSTVAAKAAESAGARLVNHFDPGCSCGRGCQGDCPANARHWFACSDPGKAKAVLDAVRAAATKNDLAILDRTSGTVCCVPPTGRPKH